MSVVALALGLMPAGPAVAASVKIASGTIAFSNQGLFSADEYLYYLNGCPSDVRDGYLAAVIGVAQYKGKWIQVRIEGADPSDDPKLSASGRGAPCDPRSPITGSWGGYPSFSFVVGNERHIRLFYTNGISRNVRYSVWVF